MHRKVQPNLFHSMVLLWIYPSDSSVLNCLLMAATFSSSTFFSAVPSKKWGFGERKSTTLIYTKVMDCRFRSEYSPSNIFSFSRSCFFSVSYIE